MDFQELVPLLAVAVAPTTFIVWELVTIHCLRDQVSELKGRHLRLTADYHWLEQRLENLEHSLRNVSCPEDADEEQETEDWGEYP